MLFISNPSISNWIIFGLVGILLVLSLRKEKKDGWLTLGVTQELKGLAILFIIFAHIGYNLSSDSNFLWPLSNFAGVGVNLFLFLSGFGLTLSCVKKGFSIKQFYAKRLKKLYLPFWIVLGFYLLLDYVFLNRSYPVTYIIHSLLGIFTSADVNKDINSPLWYFTVIAFYYALYPLVYLKKRLWLTSILLFIIPYLLLRYSFIGQLDNAHLYKVYTFAFPLGVLAASFRHDVVTFLKIGTRFKFKGFSNSVLVKKFLYISVILLLISFIIFSRIYSSPWDSPQKEQFINVLTMLAFVMLFSLKKITIKILYLFGLYSYEIYLLHWPIMSRYDLFFRHMPAWVAVIFYLILFLILGKLLNSSLLKVDKQFKKFTQN